MANWFVRLYDVPPDGSAFGGSGAFVGSYTCAEVQAEIRNSEEGTTSWELALGQSREDQPTLGITRDSFAPYRTDFQLWRDSTIITAGMLTSVNLNGDRDSILMSGKDWIHYLDRRIYPFDPDDYVTFNSERPEAYWDKWPKRWPATRDEDPVDLSVILRSLIRSMRSGVPYDAQVTSTADLAPGSLNVSYGAVELGTVGKYKINPGDSTTILSHIQSLSEMADGFEFDIAPLTLELKVWSPRRDTGSVIWRIQATSDETLGQIIDFDWTNDGPAGTYLYGMGTGAHKVGKVWSDIDTRLKFRRMDKVYDYGEMANTDVILQKLKDQNDLWPQKKLALTLLNPVFLVPSFYTAGRPRQLMGARIRVTHDFEPYHRVDAYFRINGISFGVDRSTNETVTLELEMIYEPETQGNTSGGLAVAQ